MTRIIAFLLMPALVPIASFAMVSAPAIKFKASASPLAPGLAVAASARGRAFAPVTARARPLPSDDDSFEVTIAAPEDDSRD